MLSGPTSVLLNGSSPVFFRQPSEPIPEYPEKLLAAAKDNVLQDITELIPDLNKDLTMALEVLRRFCWQVNLGTQTRGYIAPTTVYETMISVTYRLINMAFPASSTHELIRYGLLAFSYHVFLQWQDIRLPIFHFPNAYKICIVGIKVDEQVSPRLILWLSMIGACSVFNISDEA